MPIVGATVYTYSPYSSGVLARRAAATRRRIRRVPLGLTDLELETAARACRALAYQEEQAAEKFEAVRKRAGRTG